MTRFAARLAVAFGVVLGAAEVVRNWGDWGYWPFWLVDYLAVALLLVGARQALRPFPWRRTAPLAGAWGFTCAMFYMSFFTHVARLHQPDHGPIEPLRLTVAIGLLFAIAVIGLLLSLIATDRQ